MVVNLLIGIAEDQDHLEKYSTKELSELTTKNGIFSRNKNSRRVICQDFFTLTEWPYPGT